MAGKFMNIDWIRCFTEIVKRKSISKASEALNLSQPAASQQIKKLEDYFGVVLFNRSAFGMELTEAGRFLYDKLRVILRDLDDLSLELISFKTPNKISIGTIPSLAMYYLPHRIINMQSEGIEVDVQVRNTSKEVFQLLEAEEINTVLIDNREPYDGYWGTEIYQENFYAVIPSNHPLSGKDYLTIMDIEKEPLIVYPSTCDVRSAITQEYQKNHLQPKISIEVAFGESIFGFVLAGAGITIVPEVITKHTEHLPLSIIPMIDFNQKRVIALVSRSKKFGNPIAKYLSV
jgi:LysR family transcriptional regulator, transcription activator of glutamate synthase operon